MTTSWRRLKDASVSTKVNLALLFAFVLLMGASITHRVYSERALVEQVVEQQTKDTADSYFDSINTMMLTGTMGQRRLLRDKLLARPGVTEARIIRGDAVKALFGKGFPEEQPRDETERQALKGDGLIRITQGDHGRVLTVINPIRASKNYRGTNCLSCHTNMKSGEIAGAVRVSYSLAALDQQVAHNLLASAGIEIGLFALGLVLMVYTLRRVVLRPLDYLRKTMEEMEQTADLNQRVEICSSGDEIGRVALAFNRMLDRFHRSLKKVDVCAHEQRDVAERIVAVMETSTQDILEQQSQTEQVATAMNQMNTAVHDVARNATQTAEASRNVRQEAQNGAYVSTQALAGIELLEREIEHVEEVVRELDSESESIDVVLDVIKGIAEQTNLLALNAAIEAARAGESGRGFAVVADEVRTLAKRSQESAMQIQSMIESLQSRAREAVTATESAKHRAHDGMEQVERAAESLGVIAGDVGAINDRNAQIATAAEEQSTVAEEINRNVASISRIADRTSESARQTAQVGGELLDLAIRLEELVGQFKIS